jgi:hypothetical protein
VKDERPEGSVPRSQGKRCRLRPEEDGEMMAKGNALGHEDGPRKKTGAEGAESESNAKGQIAPGPAEPIHFDDRSVFAGCICSTRPR